MHPKGSHSQALLSSKTLWKKKKKKWKEEKKNISITITQAQNELPEALFVIAVKEEHIKALINDIERLKKVSSEVPFTGFNNKEIEDLVRMQGNSMADMTQAFQAVVQEVNVIKKCLTKTMPQQ